jgi:site-specific recombinase XerD
MVSVCIILTEETLWSELRKRMLRDMQMRNFSPATQKGYIHAVVSLAKYYNRSPDKIMAEELQNYIVHLLTEKKLAISSCCSIVTKLRFFYQVTLGWETKDIPIVPFNKETRLPEILSTEELEQLFAASSNPKHRVLLMTTYSGGLRVSEVVHLKVTDIHSKRMMIRIDQGKGRKDRYTILSQRVLEELRKYWNIERPQVWLFPGQNPDKPMTKRTAERIYANAVSKAGIKRKGGIHTLRHCFATHLLETGVDIRTIQLLMGRRSILSTMRYLQVTSKTLEGTRSPLDIVPASTDTVEASCVTR